MQNDNFDPEYDAVIMYLILLLSVVCGQGEPLKDSEKGLLPDIRLFCSVLMLHFRTFRWFLLYFIDASICWRYLDLWWGLWACEFRNCSFGTINFLFYYAANLRLQQFAISSQFRKAQEDPIVCGLYTTPQAAALGRQMIHITNRGVKPSWLQGTALSTCKKIFEYSQAQQSEGFFFTNGIIT